LLKNLHAPIGRQSEVGCQRDDGKYFVQQNEQNRRPKREWMVRALTLEFARCQARVERYQSMHRYLCQLEGSQSIGMIFGRSNF
jgi:hypothetical protein